MIPEQTMSECDLATMTSYVVPPTVKLMCRPLTVMSPVPADVRSLNLMVPTLGIVTSPLGGTGMFAPVGLVIDNPETEDCALHIGLAISQQLHCDELLTLLAVII
jgi:hypothetical protein